MLELTGNLWDVPAEARVITTNGTLSRRGTAVMGRGCAYEAYERFPGVEVVLGNLLRERGNHVFLLLEATPDRAALVSFPTKQVPWMPSDLDLIRQSARELVLLADEQAWCKVVLPRPGCGNGGFQWEFIRRVLGEILDDRFTSVHREERHVRSH
jgi:hypothetical protein